jgi:hypothetical protein
LLAKLAELRVLAGPYGIRAIVLTPPDVVFSFDELVRVRPLFETGPGSPRVPDGNTIHWRLPARLLAPPETLIEAIRRQLAGAAEAPAPAKGAPTAAR